MEQPSRAVIEVLEEPSPSHPEYRYKARLASHPDIHVFGKTPQEAIDQLFVLFRSHGGFSARHDRYEIRYPDRPRSTRWGRRSQKKPKRENPLQSGLFEKSV